MVVTPSCYPAESVVRHLPIPTNGRSQLCIAHGRIEDHAPQRAKESHLLIGSLRHCHAKLRQVTAGAIDGASPPFPADQSGIATLPTISDCALYVS